MALKIIVHHVYTFASFSIRFRSLNMQISPNSFSTHPTAAPIKYTNLLLRVLHFASYGYIRNGKSS